METLFLSIAAVIFVYIVVTMLMPRVFTGAHNAYTQKALNRIYVEARQEKADEYDDEELAGPNFIRTLFEMPILKPTGALLLKSGMGPYALRFLLGVIGLFFLLTYATLRFQMGPVGILFVILLTLYLPRAYLKRRIRKRNELFIHNFPDALDMIVRSVRSGFPLITALKMIVENMEAPISTEFKQVVDEVAYGRPLTDALSRLAARIDEPDIQFFVVVLSVQQESGGNLAEVMNNLSNVIRSRKQLRLKIKSMTSEGRATGWVLGSLPVFIFFILLAISPEHLQPLFNTSTGHIVLLAAASLVAISAWIVNQMIQIDI